MESQRKPFTATSMRVDNIRNKCAHAYAPVRYEGINDNGNLAEAQLNQTG
jgi:hypothetical protein